MSFEWVRGFVGLGTWAGWLVALPWAGGRGCRVLFGWDLRRVTRLDEWINTIPGYDMDGHTYGGGGKANLLLLGWKHLGKSKRAGVSRQNKNNIRSGLFSYL